MGDVWLVGTHPDAVGQSAAADPLVIELEGSRYPGASIRDAFGEEHAIWREEHEGTDDLPPFPLLVAPDRLKVITEIFAHDTDPGFRAGFAAYQQQACDATTARRLLELGYALDVTDAAAIIAVPTAVIDRDGDQAIPVAEGTRLAAAIPGATLTVLPGRPHVPFAGDVDALIDAIRSGLAMPPLTRRFAPTLTRRQLEVAGLVAQGLSNRRIGARLVITERSAESHVERIRDRLGFRSRTQIAAWYVTAHAGLR